MSRCRACNTKLQDYEMLSKNPQTGKPEEMCRQCINEGSGYQEGLKLDCMDVPLIDGLDIGPKTFS